MSEPSFSDEQYAAVDDLIEGCVVVCGKHSTETLKAVAAMPSNKDTWIGGMVRDYIEAWREGE